MKNLIVGLLFQLIACALFSQSDTLKPIIFITDASGSMWQKVGEEYKIVIAKEVLSKLVSELPENQAVGLVAYGHRQKGDCNDIEELVPASNLDKTFFTEKLNALNPVGKTPLALSVKSVIEQLKKEKSSATIILITDGIETCEGNLCDLVKEAKAAGIDFVMHVVGFDLKNEDKTLLECAANEGEGIYVDASDKDQLTEALNQTSELTVDVPPGRLAVKCIRNGELIDASVVILKAGTDEGIASRRTYNRETTNPTIFKIPSGTYDVEASLISKRGIASGKISNVEVTDSLQEKLFDFTSGSFEFKVTNMDELHDATINVTSLATGKNVEGGRTYTDPRNNPMIKELTPGWYRFLIKSVTIRGDNNQHTIDSVEIKAGETTVLSHNFESVQLTVGATHNGELEDVTVNIASETTGKGVAGGRTYTSSSSNPKTFLLSPGKYKVVAKGIKIKGAPNKSFTIELKAGDIEKKIFEF